MRAYFFALITLLLVPFAALAQSADRPNTILVLDGSGSMWGQIDGENKIVIARQVIAEMLAEMADDVSLGLTVYGHRQRGSCTDIETIVAPAPGTQAQILDAVNAINPRGRTPMTDAVIAAAQSLRSTEEAATVILVSDGIENCNPDPCAIAAELEAAGVDFTAHVIGFDVASEPEARAQMQCIADNTGGQFLTADNAAELSQALEQIVAVTPTAMRIEAQVLPQGNLPTRPVTWTLLGPDGTPLSSGTPGPAIDVSLLPGTYVAQATRTEPEGPQTYQTSFTVIEGQTDLIIVAMPPIIETSQVTFTARVQPDMSVPASALAWTLFDSADTVLLGPVVAPGGNVALLPGDYRLLVERANTGTRHEARFTVDPNTPQEVIIPLPALNVEIDFTARIGSETGPVITDPVVWDVAPLDSNPVTTNPATFLMSRGAYRVTAYWTAQEIEQSLDFVVVDQPREITVVFPEPLATATLTAPATAPMGATIQVGWDGPGAANDFIAITSADADPGGYHRFANTTDIEDGNPVSLLMPPVAGEYLLEYVLGEDRTRVASVPITVTPVPATLTAPATAIIGDTIEVAWSGPDYANDVIAITAVDAEGYHRFANTTDTEDGTPLDLLMPVTPGEYVIEYVIAQDRTRVATVPITLTQAPATLSAAATGAVGSTIEVAWTGPDYASDFIAITPADGSGYHRFSETTRTNEGSPLSLLLPTEPGDYVLEYVLGQDRVTLVSQPFTVTELSATLTGPAQAIAGASVEIGWTGPAYDGDFIAITEMGGEGYHRFTNTTRVTEGNPLTLLMPSAPGAYMLEYVLGQDRVALVTAPITVTPTQASLTAPSSATAGQIIEVGFTGPGYANDFIAITRVGAEGYHRFSDTARIEGGSPVQLQMPVEAGSYEIEYVLGQDRARLTAVPIEIGGVSATVTAPATAVAGSTIEVGFTGPMAEDDYIGIGLSGSTGSDQWRNYTRVADGNPVSLLVPGLPGTYTITYFLDQDRTPLASVEIEVSAVPVSVTAPASALAGSTIEIAWNGPNYPGDFVGLGMVGTTGSDQWRTYVTTDEGAPARLRVPGVAGDYVLRYFLDQRNTPVHEQPFTVLPHEVSMIAPTTGPAGGQIEVAWTGPGYEGDFIGVGPVGGTGSDQWRAYTYTEQGSPLTITLPDAPGDYVLRYFLDQRNTPIYEQPLTVQ